MSSKINLQTCEYACKSSIFQDNQLIYAEIEMKKTEWKKYIKDLVKDLLKTKPEAVYVDGDMFSIYPVVHQLRKKHIPVLTSVTKDGEKLIIRIPSGS